MEWINATLLVGLVVFAVYHRNKIGSLGKNLSSLEDKLNAHESLLAHAGDGSMGKLAGLVVVGSNWRDLLLGEVACHIADHAVFVAKRKIHLTNLLLS